MRPRSPGCSSPKDEKGMLCCGLPGGITSLHDNHATLKRPISCFKIERFLIFNKCLPEIGVRVRLSTPCHLSLKVILRLILEFEVEVVCLRLGTRMGRLTSCVSLCSTAVAQATPSGGHSSSPWRPLHYPAIWCNSHNPWNPNIPKDIKSLWNTRSHKWLILWRSNLKIDNHECEGLKY